MPDIAFLADVPASVALDAGKACSRIQLAKTGTFQDRRYGKFSITTAMFESWERNFMRFSAPEAGRQGLPIDFDHSPETGKGTEAAGWVVKLDRMGRDGATPTPDQLWGTCEWTDIGLDALQNRRYAYISPTFPPDYADETGAKHGTHLVGAALTNRPFLNMAVVSLSRASTAEQVADDVPDSPGHMPELNKEFLISLGLSDDSATKVLSADNPGAAAKAALEEITTPVGTADVKTLAEQASEQGMVLMSGTDLVKLTADAAAGAAAAAELHTTKFATAWTLAVDDGKVLPASEDTFRIAYEAKPDETLKALADLPKGTIKVTTEGSGGGGSDDPTVLSAETKAMLADDERLAAPDPARDRVNVRLNALMGEGKSLDEAIEIVESEGMVA
jgi:phage I-like protein